MNKRIVIHYFLFLAIILGGFASMAQNNYGLTIISGSCFIFALLFLWELINKLNKVTVDKVAELISLMVLFTLFGFRAIYFHFAFVEAILIISAVCLIGIYAYHLNLKMKTVGKDNRVIKRMILMYYFSLIGFIISLIAALIAPSLSEIIGGISTMLLVALLVGMYLFRKQVIDGDEILTFSYLRNYAGHSSILITGFLLIGVYSGLYMISAVPPLYTSKLPHNYIELIHAAESGQEQPQDGVYKYQLYEKAYTDFVKKLESED